ncbi:transcriptional regulator family: Fungal Specific TF, partial [Penicillium malachiteum]
MDEKVPLRGYEHTLPVLSRPSAAAWPVTDPTPHTDPYTGAPIPATLIPTALPAHTTAQGSVPAPVSDPIPTSNSQLSVSKPTTGPERNGSTKVRKPRKAANTTGKSTLFWVNTDPETAAAGTKEETLKRIRSHVMSEHNRKKRLENTKRYKSKTWKHLPFQPEHIPGGVGPPRPPSPPPSSASSLTSASNESRRVSYAFEDNENKELIPVTHASGYYYPPVSAEAWNDTGFDGVVGYQSRPAAPPIWTYVGPGAHDPFNTGHTQLTDRMMRHLQNFLWDLTQEAHPLQTRYKPKLQAHWAALIQRDPTVLHAVICMSTSNAAMRRGELPVRDPTQPHSALVVDTFHHRGETIRLVNKGLSDPVKAASDELIAAVSTLLTIEIASGNPDYLKIHLAGLRQMIGLRKNFADVPPDVRFQISWTDIRVACMAMTKPIFPFVRSTRPAGFSLLPPTDEVALTASRLIPLMKIPGIFSESLTKIIYDLLELSWYAEWIKGGSGFKDFSEETEDYFNLEVLSVEYSLHTDRYLPTGQVKGDNSIEGCSRLACLCFHNSAIWSFYPMIAPLLPKPILALRAALEATLPTGLFALCRDLLIWLLFIGAACSQVMPAERTYFVTELATAAQLHGVTSWQECRGILLGFFYADRVYLPMLRQIWQEVQMQQVDVSPV